MHTWIGAGGLTIAGDTWGDPQGPLVVLQHGGGLASTFPGVAGLTTAVLQDQRLTRLIEEGALARNAWTATGAWAGYRAADWASLGIGGIALRVYR
jgi:hypothetical protein